MPAPAPSLAAEGAPHGGLPALCITQTNGGGVLYYDRCWPRSDPSVKTPAGTPPLLPGPSRPGCGVRGRRESQWARSWTGSAREPDGRRLAGRRSHPGLGRPGIACPRSQPPGCRPKPPNDTKRLHVVSHHNDGLLMAVGRGRDSIHEAHAPFAVCLLSGRPRR